MRKYSHRLRNFILIGLIAGFFGTGTLLLWAASLKAPDLSSLESRKVEQSTKIYDRTGEVLLFDLHENVTRTVVSYDSISRNIKNATVAIEDAEFYQHKGIKPTAILRAVFANLLSFGFEQGGSTITQQVIKNSVLVQDKTISRKLKEWILAVKLEQVASKDTILNLYLNETPYGGTIYGIEEASQNFFGTSSTDLTLAQAAYLAALPQAPTFYSPYGNHRDALENRKNLVLSRMLENKFISEEEYSQAKTEEVDFLPQRDSGIKAPHFVFFVREYLENKYGQRAVEERGFRVITSLDYTLQAKAEDIVKRYALENEEKFNAENAALVALDPRNGEILTMVGSRDYFDEKIDGNFNAAIAPNRQPGSAFKPFIYAEAFKKGYTPDTVVFDLKTQFSTVCAPNNFTSDGDCYSPSNYDNTFRGPMTLRDALAQSVNIPAIKAFYLAGLRDSLRLAQSMGIQSLVDINRYGLTLVLGGGEVSLLDITSAYGVFANKGVRNPYTSILRIEDAEGNIIEEARQNSTRVLDEQVAEQISDVLSDNIARTPAFGANSALYFPNYDVAVKTGTTNEYRDAWIVGYTPNISVGAWAGNNDNSPMEKRVAGFIIAPLWNEFMKEALAVREVEYFTDPKEPASDTKPILRGLWEGGEVYTVDLISGKLATQYTPEETKEDRVVKNIHNILHWVDKSNPEGPAPKDPAKDPQYLLWEYPVQLWKAREGIENETSDIIPNQVDDIHIPANFPSVSFVSPGRNQEVTASSRIDIQISTNGKYAITEAEYFLNGTFVGSSKRAPFSISFSPQNVAGVSPNSTLSVVVKDAVLNKAEVSIPIRISL